jgi:hypothetical protein
MEALLWPGSSLGVNPPNVPFTCEEAQVGEYFASQPVNGNARALYLYFSIAPDALWAASALK